MNTNCLEGWKCPKCGQEDEFRVTAVTTVRLIDNGIDDEEGGFEYNEDSPARCPECGVTSTVGYFTGGAS